MVVPPTVERSFLHQLTTGFLDLVYPPICHLCDQSLREGEIQFCAECANCLREELAGVCPHCAATVGPHLPLEHGCSLCREERFRFDRVIRLGKYADKHRDAVLRIKHRHHEGLAEILGMFLATCRGEELRGMQPEVIVPMPLHWMRRWQRGYNQAASLARGLARELRLPCHAGWLWRRRNTPSQASLTATERRKNPKGAFKARARAMRGKHVLLVDDVLTTGTTANEAAKALLAAGAAKVSVAVIARGEGADQS